MKQADFSVPIEIKALFLVSKFYSLVFICFYSILLTRFPVYTKGNRTPVSMRFKINLLMYLMKLRN